MSEIIDRIPGEHSAVAAVQRIAATSLQFKAAQRLSGKSGQLGYAVQSSSEWDLIESLPVPPGSSYWEATYLVTFTGDGSQSFPIALPVTDLRVNGTGESNRLRMIPSSGLYNYEDAFCDVIVQSFERPDPSLFASPSQSAWRISLLYSGTATIRIKCSVQATSDGTVSAVRVA